MAITRREILLGLAATPVWLSGCGGGSGTTISTSSQPPAASSPPPVAAPEPLPPEILSRMGDFQPLEGEVFYIDHPIYGSLEAQLQPLTAFDYDPALEQFTLSFDLPEGAALAEGSHQVSHHQGASFDLFLQPAESQRLGYERYTAVFSHLVE